MHAIDINAEEKKPQPKLRSFFKIGDLPYEFNEYDVTSIIGELLHNHGAAQLTITRSIVDEGDLAPTPAPAPAAQLPMPAHIQSALADLASQYGADSPVLADVEAVLRNAQES